MRAPVVEIIEIVRQDLLQLPPIENEQMIHGFRPINTSRSRLKLAA